MENFIGVMITWYDAIMDNMDCDVVAILIEDSIKEGVENCAKDYRSLCSKCFGYKCVDL